MATAMKFFCSCVGWDLNDVDSEGGLRDMIEQSKRVVLQTFVDKVDFHDWSLIKASLGYSPSFPIKKDWAVKFYRSKLHGKTVYYMCHSAIEYVFVPENFV